MVLALLAGRAGAAPVPDLELGTYYGGFGLDTARALARSGAGGFLLAGSTTSETGMATPNAFQTGYGSGFVARFDAAGPRVWGAYLGTGGTNVYGVAEDAEGFIYVAGYTSSPTGIATADAY